MLNVMLDPLKTHQNLVGGIPTPSEKYESQLG